jgi:hypothetical protein
MKTFENREVAELFDAYPKKMREKLMFLRGLVFQTADETEGVGPVEETLKWGQPSYIAKRGSTIRIDSRNAATNQYAMYFHCTSRLVETFRELYGGKFKFEGNRAILFDADDEVPVAELKHCIALSLTYHTRKHLPLLGA